VQLHLFSSVFIRFHPFSSVFIRFHPFSSVFIRFHQILPDVSLIQIFPIELQVLAMKYLTRDFPHAFPLNGSGRMDLYARPHTV